MAGLSSRFIEYGFKTPKHLLSVNDKNETMLEKAILTLNVSSKSNFIFILREEHDEDINVRELISNICTEHDHTYDIISTKTLTEGPASSCYLAKSLINNDIPLIISNCDQILDYNYESFISECEQYDGCVMTYTPSYEIQIGMKDKHSFIEIKDDNIVKFSEKIALSDKALVGVHYYKKGSYFISSYEDMIEKDERAPNGEFYISLTYNSMLRNNYNIGYHHLNSDEHYYPTGTPEDYFYYIEHISKHWFKTYNLKDFVRGWIIGDFEPSIIRRKDIEIGLLSHKKDEIWPYHIHNETEEINVLISGLMKVNERIIRPNEIFIFPKGVLSCPIFLEDCKVLCIKHPSNPNDKKIV